MKFKHSMGCKSSIKKKKEYIFENITAKDILKAKKATFEKPYLISSGLCRYALYLEKGKIILQLLHSYDVFEGIE